MSIVLRAMASTGVTVAFMVGGIVGVTGSAAAGEVGAAATCATQLTSPNSYRVNCTGMGPGVKVRAWVRCGNENYKAVGPWRGNGETSEAYCNWDDELRSKGQEFAQF
ncbi:hypothetical protein [Pseudonocardia sp. TRM90224]|uniref:hypothetical protein n=1 Tax=Pseudonocardia sp. TRM90224 TaxID=2812678 RepID=UPI001E3E9F92|nr:hypothetical protein [Pseudonocardia sp. TRM90224]